MSNNYKTEVQWGGNDKPWHDNGTFVLGGRDNQPPIALNIKSSDGGKSFTGTMQYGPGNPTLPGGEGPIGFRAQNIGQNNYKTEVQWGGNDKPWHDNGAFVLSGRDNQPPIALDIKSSDGGKSFTGTMQYGPGNPALPGGEGPIGFRAQKVA